MFVEFGGLETFDCIIEIQVNSQKQIQNISAPQFIIMQQFIGLVNEAMHSSSPVRVKMSRKVQCYDEWEDRQFNQENSIEFKNKAYLSSEYND